MIIMGYFLPMVMHMHIKL